VKNIRLIPLLVVGLLVIVAAGCSSSAETKPDATGAAAELAKTGRGQEAGTAEMQPGPGNASADTRLGSGAGGK